MTDRKINYKFMFREAWYILSGHNELHYLTEVLPKFADFHDGDEELQPGSYGPPFVDQLSYVVNELRRDPLSRRAVMSIWRPRPGKTTDTPCTISLQFLIRDNELVTIASMRSSDVYTGLIYDVFCFSMMAKAVAAIGEFPSPGRVFIIAGSSHIYHKDVNHTLSLVTEEDSDNLSNLWIPNGLSFRELKLFLKMVSDQDKPLTYLKEFCHANS